jgi:acyl-CoA thioester hydrolase
MSGDSGEQEKSGLHGPVVTRLRVRYGECDPQGIVFNANYLLYADVAFTEFWRAAVGPWLDMVEHGVDAVVAEARLAFRASARFDDELQLSVTPLRLGATSLASEIAVRRGIEELVTIEVRHVCIDIAAHSKLAWPAWIRDALARADAA